MTWRPEDWKSGDVAMVAVNDGVGWRRGFRCGVPSNPGWQVGDPARNLWVNDTRITDARRLVVLDPESDEDAERVAAAAWWPGHRAARAAVQAALRAMVTPPEPPKPVEPTGLGAVVEDRDGLDWHRSRNGRWVSYEGLRAHVATWGHIEAVRVLSEGVR